MTKDDFLSVMPDSGNSYRFLIVPPDNLADAKEMIRILVEMGFDCPIGYDARRVLATDSEAWYQDYFVRNGIMFQITRSGLVFSIGLGYCPEKYMVSYREFLQVVNNCEEDNLEIDVSLLMDMVGDD